MQKRCRDVGSADKGNEHLGAVAGGVVSVMVASASFMLSGAAEVIAMACWLLSV